MDSRHCFCTGGVGESGVVLALVSFVFSGNLDDDDSCDGFRASDCSGLGADEFASRSNSLNLSESEFT